MIEKVCSRCGRPNYNADFYCLNCGKKVFEVRRRSAILIPTGLIPIKGQYEGKWKVDLDFSDELNSMSPEDFLFQVQARLYQYNFAFLVQYDPEFSGRENVIVTSTSFLAHRVGLKTEWVDYSSEGVQTFELEPEVAEPEEPMEAEPVEEPELDLGDFTCFPSEPE